MKYAFIIIATLLLSCSRETTNCTKINVVIHENNWAGTQDRIDRKRYDREIIEWNERESKEVKMISIKHYCRY